MGSKNGSEVFQRPHWRFEDLEVWQLGRDLAAKFHKLASQLEDARLYRYAEQLRGAGLSIPNNISEGSGSDHPNEFRRFLNIARRSAFENASMLLVFEKLELIDRCAVDELLADCAILSKKITNLSRSLRP